MALPDDSGVAARSHIWSERERASVTFDLGGRVLLDTGQGALRPVTSSHNTASSCLFLPLAFAG